MVFYLWFRGAGDFNRTIAFRSWIIIFFVLFINPSLSTKRSRASPRSIEKVTWEWVDRFLILALFLAFDGKFLFSLRLRSKIPS